MLAMRKSAVIFLFLLSVGACSKAGHHLSDSMPYNDMAIDAGRETVLDLTHEAEIVDGGNRDLEVEQVDTHDELKSDVQHDSETEALEVSSMDVADVPCVPDCGAKECGSDGCQGSCGDCPDFGVCAIGECLEGECVVVLPEACCETDEDCVDCANYITGESCAMDISTSPGLCAGGNACVVNMCTTDVCLENQCKHGVLTGCCLADYQCDDNHPCTDDECDNGLCINTFKLKCCHVNGACNDGDICTVDVCEIPEGEETGACVYLPKEDCCHHPNECPPKACHDTYCANGNCVYVDDPACCVHDEECDDNDPCTIDKCIGSSCDYSDIVPCP